MAKYSAYINDAKATLLDDLRRATYLMELKGIDIEESTEIHDSDFMMDIFLLQEQIEDGGSKECAEVKNNIQDILITLQTEFDNFFKSQDLLKCKEFVFKYKYLHRALTNVNNKLHSLKEA